MLCLYAVFMKLLMGVWVYFVFVKEISDFVSGRFDGIRIVGIVFGQVVSVISVQSISQCVCWIGCVQQIVVMLNGVFIFQYGNYDWVRGYEFNQIIKEWFFIVFSIKVMCLFNGQVQYFGVNNFEFCSFKVCKDIINDVFCYCVWFDDGKSMFNSYFYFCKLFCCCLYQCMRWCGL